MKMLPNDYDLYASTRPEVATMEGYTVTKNDVLDTVLGLPSRYEGMGYRFESVVGDDGEVSLVLTLGVFYGGDLETWSINLSEQSQSLDRIIFDGVMLVGADLDDAYKQEVIFRANLDIENAAGLLAQRMDDKYGL